MRKCIYDSVIAMDEMCYGMQTHSKFNYNCANSIDDGNGLMIKFWRNTFGALTYNTILRHVQASLLHVSTITSDGVNLAMGNEITPFTIYKFLREYFQIIKMRKLPTDFNSDVDRIQIVPKSIRRSHSASCFYRIGSDCSALLTLPK